MRALILHNDESGFGSDAIFLFARALTHQGDECVMRVLPHEWVAEQEAKDARDFDLVVVSGGDSTVAKLLWALKGTNVPICVFPSDTTNIFFNALGNSPEPSTLARACRICDTVTSDLVCMSWLDPAGVRHQTGVTIMSGMGFDATLMRAAVPNKRSMGEAAYVMAALNNPRPEQVDFEVKLNGATIQRQGIGCLVANTATLLADIELVDNCRLNDGLLDCIMLEASDTVSLVRPLIAGILDPRGTSLPRPTIERFQGTIMEVAASKPLPIQINGDALPYEVSGYTAEVVPGCLQLIVDNLSPYASKVPPRPRFPETEIVAYPH